MMNFPGMLAAARRCTAAALRNTDRNRVGGVVTPPSCNKRQRLVRSMATTRTAAPGRAPTPPMPRVLPTNGATTATQTTTPQQLHQEQHIITRRPPLPPMPRVLASSSSSFSTVHASAATVVADTAVRRNSSRLLREWWDNGNMLLILGWTGLAVFTLDRFLQYQQRIDARDMAESIVYDSKLQRKALLLKWKDQPALFNCVIRREYKQMGGSYGLRGILVGDIVEVLEEAIGPDKHYNLCRIQKDDGSGGNEEQIGWFPMSFMEKIEEKKPNKSLWRRILRR